MMWTIDYDNLESIAVGAGILGTGGGGSPYLGKLMTRLCLDQGAQIQIVDTIDVPDDAICASVGGMGAPTVSVEKIAKGDEPLVALRALEMYTGKQVDYLVPWEIGGTNSMRPLVQAARSGLPVVDADAMGRAFPELQMCTYSIYGIPGSPGAISDVRGDVALFPHISTDQRMEHYARAVTIEMGGHAGIASPIMTGADVKRTGIPGTMAFARDLGSAVRQARANLTDPVQAVVNICQGQVLFRGKITSVERRMAKGFSRGEVIIDGLDNFGGDQLSIDFQNENLIARIGEKVLATVPDLICIVDSITAESVTTEVLRYGLRVTVLGIPAPRLLKSEQALAVVGPGAFGYDVPFVPLAGVYGSEVGS